MAVEKLEVVNEVELSADKVYQMWKDDIHEIPKHIPHIYKSVKHLEGEHGTENCPIKMWHYEIEGRDIHVVERTTVHDESRTVTHTVIGGELFGIYKSFVAEVSVTPKLVDGEENGSLVKWVVSYEKKHEDDPAPTAYIALFEQITLDLNSQVLLKQSAS